MTVDFQASLFEGATVGVGPLAGRVHRTELTRGAWVDVLPGWFGGADTVFEDLLHEVPWRAEERPMYDGIVAVPRLLHTYGVGEELPHPALTEAREALTAHYLRMHRSGQRPDATWEAFGESVPYLLGRAVAVLG